MPFSLPTTLPSKEVPVPNGTTGTLCLLHRLNTFETSSFVSGKTTAFERTGS